MNPKRFWGQDMGEALRAVRNTLGPDALIMNTRSVTRDNGGGVEIIALVSGEIAEDSLPDESAISEVDTLIKKPADPLDEVHQELSALKSILCWLAPELNHKDEVFKALLDQGLAPEIIARLAATIKQGSGADGREGVYAAMSRMIPSGGQIRQGRDVLALVGPTGVGKTTSLVKLTIFETQRRNCSVAWVNTDQRGLKGGDPLALYAGILGVRYEIAACRKDLKRVLERLSDCELILVDTPGVSPRDEAGIKELIRQLHGIPELRPMLLLSAVTNGRDLADWVEIYAAIGSLSLFFTKLDECRYFGPLVNTALGAAVPLAYITLGQNLAGDLEIAKPEVFASLLLTGVDQHD